MYPKLLSLLVALCAVCATATGRFLDLDENYKVEVDITGEGDTAIITFTFTVNKLGYIGFGIGPHPNMTDADLFIGGVDTTTGELYGKDYHGTGNEMPVEDCEACQNWNVIWGNETDGVTLFKAERLLDTRDTEEDIKIENAEIYVLWSYGEFDELVHHYRRGVRLLNLITADDSPGTTTSNPSSSTETERTTPETTTPESTTPETTTPETTTPETSTPETPSTTTSVEPPTLRHLHLDDTYTLDLIITGSGSTGIIQLVLRVNTEGFIGFGMSRNPSMTGADMFIGGFDQTTNRTYGRDYHATGNQMPFEDVLQDWFVATGEEKDGMTTLIIARYLDTNDTTEDIAIENSNIYLLWSFGETDTIGYHTKRGLRQLNLFTVDDGPSATTTAPPSTAPTPSSSTSYGTIRYLSVDSNYNVELIIIGSGSIGIVQLVLKVNTIGYVGLGLRHNPNMEGADLFIGGFDTATNMTYGKDYYGIGNGLPSEDNNGQDWVVLSGAEEGGMTTLLISRRLEISDDNEDIAIEDSDIHVLWSYGESDTLNHHIARGSRLVNLFTVDDSNRKTTSVYNRNDNTKRMHNHSTNKDYLV